MKLIEMKNTKAYIIISELIFKERTNSINEQEKLQLENWINASEENKDIYDRIVENIDVGAKIDASEEIDLDLAWKELNQKMKPSGIKSRSLFGEILKYASVILLPILLAGLVFFLNDQKKETQYTNSIVPGTNKAILILENGNVIDLIDSQNKIIDSIGDMQINNSNYKLSYNKSRTKMPAESATSNKLIPHKIEYHRIKIPVGGEYQLQLSDGTQVWLNSNTELRYPDVFLGKKRVVFLRGEAFFKVQKDKKHPFIVKTHDMNVKVYGTEFNVSSYRDDDYTQTTLLEGSVGISLKQTQKNEKEIRLKPNTQLTFYKNSEKSLIKEVNASQFIGWKDGKFQFENESLEQITHKLERWYDVSFFFQNASVKEIHYTGDMKRFDEFSSILNLLEIGSGVKFVVKDKVVIVQEY